MGNFSTRLDAGPATFRDFMNTNCIYWTYNNKQIQHVLSNRWDAFCIDYVYYKFHGYAIYKTLNSFKKNMTINDYIVLAARGPTKPQLLSA